MPSPSQDASWLISLVLWLAFTVPHLLTGLFLMYKDCNGSWEAFRLSPVHSGRPRWYKYKKCIPSFTRDVVLLLPLALSICTPYLITRPTTALALLQDCVKVPVAYTAGRIWAMAMHYVMHIHPKLYCTIHKHHHVPTKELCAFAAFRDHPLEFLLMEVPGTFVIGPILCQLHWISTALLLAYHGASSAIDHSGFYVNWLVDGRYHFVHHIKPKRNYAEMEFLDKLMGTYESP